MFSKHDILKGVRGTVANSLQYVVFDIKGLESQSLLLHCNISNVSFVIQSDAEQGWPSDESTCLPPRWPGFDFRTRIEFVGSLLCRERFSPGYSGFPLSFKTNISFDLICE